MPRMFLTCLRAAIGVPLVVLSACCSTQPLEDANQCSWVLACVQLDTSVLGNAGSLPIYRRADGYTFGREPVALGTMQGSRDGLWSINVRFKEPVVAFSGRSGVHEYDVLTLAGKCKKGGACIAAQGAFPSNVAMGVATEVYVKRLSKTRLSVQPATRGKRLPYVFIFDSTKPAPQPVSVPLV
jgi:hypothetical protein